MKKNIAIFILYFFSVSYLFSQKSESDLKEIFLAAESYFLFEEYEEALPLYLNLNKAFPDNSNYHFKIGVCYLNNPFEKEKSIDYLEKAIKNINLQYKKNSFKETSAPLEALFYLGNAYRINNQLRKAREYYNKFLNQLDPEIYDVQLVKDQLSACAAAENLMKKPVDFDVENLREPVNSRFSDINPVVSGDETKMVYVSKLQFYDAVFYTEKIDGKWITPRNIMPELGVDADVYPTCLSYDGKEMFVYRNDDYLGNLYSCKIVNGKWTHLVKLNDNINTKYWESHASLSKDGKTLYFTSNRKGSYGGLDIYYSRKQSNGDWGPAINMGPVINTKYNEETPFITEDENKIFFSSYGHYNMGGYDIFMSIRIKDTVWTKPVNIGYPINTTDDNIFFNPLKNGAIAYYSVFDKNGIGRNDICRYLIYSPDNPRRFAISGRLDYAGQTVRGSEITISVMDSLKSDTLSRVHPDMTGKFTLELPSGKYNLIIESEKFQKSLFTLIIPPITPHSGTTLPKPIQLKPLPTVLSLEDIDKLLEITDTFMIVRNNRPVSINYKAEKGSRVTIDVYHESTHIVSDHLIIDRPKQSFRFNPLQGTNKVIIQLNDGKGNIINKSVTVIKESPDIFKVPGQLEPPVPGVDTETISDKSLLESFRQQLLEKSEGRLREVLKNLDLEKEGISSPEELNKYLYDNADKFGYSISDTDILLHRPLDKPEDINKLRIIMAELSSGILKDYLTNMNPGDYDFKSCEQLIGYLEDHADYLGFTKEDVHAVLLKIIYQENLNAVIQEMISKSPEKLQKVLQHFDPDLKGIQTSDELITCLLDNPDKYGYTKKDMIQLIEKLSAYASLKDFIELMKRYAYGNLKNVLDTLDLHENGIFTINGLIRYLIAHSEMSGITEGEIWDIVGRLAADKMKEPAETVLPEKRISAPAKKHFLLIPAAAGFLIIIFFLIWLGQKRKKK